MSTRTAAGLAWLTLGLCTLVTGVAIALSAVIGTTANPFSVGLLAFPVVGALVVRRQPRNAIGWVLLAVGATGALELALHMYADYGVKIEPGSLPAPDVALALLSPMWVPLVGLPGTFLILLFPDGRLPSSRWRPWGWLCCIAMALSFLGILVYPESFADLGFPNVRNPLGIEALGPFVNVAYVFVALLPVCVIGCAVALVGRFRHSRGLARLQLKWLALGAGMTAGLYLIAMVPSLALDLPWGEGTPPWLAVLQSLAICSLLLIPVAIAIAILRHRLYDVDIVINRAVVYGTLTALLGGAYVALVLLFQLALAPVTESSGLAVAGSTLAVAALFRPARTRIQSLVDRRFFRRRYDARRTLERFGVRLRDELELESIGLELRAAVGESVQPAHTSLWLRPAPREPDR